MCTIQNIIFEMIKPDNHHLDQKLRCYSTLSLTLLSKGNHDLTSVTIDSFCLFLNYNINKIINYLLKKNLSWKIKNLDHFPVSSYPQSKKKKKKLILFHNMWVIQLKELNVHEVILGNVERALQCPPWNSLYWSVISRLNSSVYSQSYTGLHEILLLNYFREYIYIHIYSNVCRYTYCKDNNTIF